MNRSKRVMRRLILSRLFDSLKDQDPIIYPRERFTSGDLSLREIDALLAFRGDAHIEELRHALDRLEQGTFGLCISCKSPISQDVLDEDPTQRVCTSCERKFIHVAAQPQYHSLTTS